jgi:heme/copper-type cytochrome/quinol oxidase subunit 1
MYFLMVVAVLLVGGGLFGFIRAKRTAANEGSASYRRAGFSGE